MPVCVSTEVMRESDKWTIEHLVSSKELMERAGKAIFEQGKWEAPVGIICGKGNNAGDGYVVAMMLQEAGTASEGSYGRYKTILDCIFGTGFKGEVKEPAKSSIEQINASNAYVISADINSGLNGDTGLGDLYVKSDLTVSIGTYKYGHFLGFADEAMKARVNCDIGIKIIGPVREI